MVGTECDGYSDNIGYDEDIGIKGMSEMRLVIVVEMMGMVG